MDSRRKAYSIILCLIWPFSTLFIGLKNFHTKFGRNLILALYAFLGFTANSIGDLEKYERQYYSMKGLSFLNLFNELISLQNGKFYNSFISVIFGLIFESHHFYFLFLFLIYGIFYVGTLHMFIENTFHKLDIIGLMFFFGVFMFLLVRPIPNLAFYTGGVFVVYNMVSYYKTMNRKYMYFLLLAPLIHIGLAVYLILPVLLLLFKNKTWFYVVFLIITFTIGKRDFVGVLESFAESNGGTIIESKYEAYASDEGQVRLEKRYALNAAGKNIKNRILITLQGVILNYLVPIGVAILYFKRKKIFVNEHSRLLFHIVLLFWGISNLMINISQGERFVVLFSFISIGLFYIVQTSTIQLKQKTVFSYFLSIFIPLLFLFGLMAAYASNMLFKAEFFMSNFFVEFFFLNFVS